MKTAIAVVVIVILAAAAWFWQADRQALAQQGAADQQAAANDLGTYPYTCDNGSEFTLSPLESGQAVQISADAQGMFTGTATLDQVKGTSYAGAAPDGQRVAILGDGETVHLTVGSAQATCNPKPNPDEAPWNWGDMSTTTNL